MKIYNRRRGAILIRKDGILLVAGRSKKFHLPGGGANINESRKRAAERELEEELNIKAINSKLILQHRGKPYHYYSRDRDKKARDLTKVYQASFIGKIKPSHEVKYYKFWTPKSRVKLSEDTKAILKRIKRNK